MAFVPAVMPGVTADGVSDGIAPTLGGGCVSGDADAGAAATATDATRAAIGISNADVLRMELSPVMKTVPERPMELLSGLDT